MKQYDWDGISKLAGADIKKVRIVALPFKVRPMFEMRKKVVPPREERMENIGDPKPPKMGKITPKTVELPSVDDLLKEMEKATTNLWVGVDLGSEMNPSCSSGCTCLPCRSNNCGNCYVDGLAQDGSDQETVRKAVTKYRGIVWE